MAACGHSRRRVDEEGRAYKGSQLQVQIYVNRRQAELNAAIRQAVPPLGGANDLMWTSPLEADGFREYRDGAFLEKLGLDHFEQELHGFWPRRGPCWDALAYTTGSTRSVLLVEGKSYPGEAETAVSATNSSSIEMIEDALAMTRQWLSVGHGFAGTWTGGLYQTANRLAHLYFLREACGIDAYLLYLCVLDDPIQPTGAADWGDGMNAIWERLGMQQPPPYTAHILLGARPQHELDGSC